MNDNDTLAQRRQRLGLVTTTAPEMPAEPMVDDASDDDDTALDHAAAEDSSYSALLRADLPDDLRTQALLGLWRGSFSGDRGGDAE